ncbi:MAG: alpha-L-arabinofuranosidase [Bacteroidetes bacterium]|nr:MAG: alpha-L-arabinofuranosidase [Bacteroidota bacterium]
MNWTILRNTVLSTLIVAILYGFSINVLVPESSGGAPISDLNVKLVVHEKEPGVKIQPTMYGVFFEDINFAADGGLYAELVKNRSFEFTLPMMGWSQPNSNRHSLNAESGIGRIIQRSGEGANKNFLRIQVNNASSYELINEGFRGMGIKKGQKYDLGFKAAVREKGISKIIFQLINQEGAIIGETSTLPEIGMWKEYGSLITTTDTCSKAKLKITFEGSGSIDMDMISLFPQDTWKGRKGGLRKDIVQLLYDLKPGFLRFPGGCIVEGRTLARRYQWKKTVGPVEQRELLVNRWNTEFRHRPTPDYYQSFGLGFYEYFLLSEDLGAEPLPILGCGIACQFNTGELVPLDELDSYVADALDLIEFANGDESTKWGKLRIDMGHPEPFGMKYIGIGNEQWGDVYIERYKVFEKAIKDKYPEIIIISGSGPFPDGDFFEYGWKELKKLNAEIIDEHYYRPPQWFRDNADRYDSYDRNGPKVFAGEYAAHPRGVEDGPKENNWEAALAEAAFMTGLERNADVVHLTAYAPLMAHIDAYQWAPDLIWFNNMTAYGTVNYQVQKMFSTNAGAELMSISMDGTPVTGQGDLYASSVKEGNVVIIKLVNTSPEARQADIRFEGKNKPGKGKAKYLASDDLKVANSFEDPGKISPKGKDVEIVGQDVKIGLEPYSFTVVKVGLK